MDIKSFQIGFFVGAGAIIFLFFVIFLMKPLIRAKASGTKISLLDIVFIKLRGLNANIVIDTMVTLLHRSEKVVHVNEIESVYLANKNSIITAEDLVSLIEQKKKEK